MNITTEQAKKVLSDAGYCVENLWHISDVTDNYHCSDEQAKKLLDVAICDYLGPVSNDLHVFFCIQVYTVDCSNIHPSGKKSGQEDWNSY